MPSVLVTKSFVSPVSLLVSVTVTPGNTAPPADTVPRISPVFLLCENASPAMPSRRQNASAQRMKLVMEFLPRLRGRFPSSRMGLLGLRNHFSDSIPNPQFFLRPTAKQNIAILLALRLVLSHYSVLPNGLAPSPFRCQDKNIDILGGKLVSYRFCCFIAAHFRIQSGSDAGWINRRRGPQGNLQNEVSQEKSRSGQETSHNTQVRGRARRTYRQHGFRCSK